jgi:hypothetical protein
MTAQGLINFMLNITSYGSRMYTKLPFKIFENIANSTVILKLTSYYFETCYCHMV